MSIPIINVDNVNPIQVPNVIVPSWMYQHPNVDHLVPPVVVNIGNPIIDMPGCVKMHQDNQYHTSGLPVDRNLVQDDPDKAMIVCDAEVPSYDAMNYEPEQLIITREAPVPPVAPLLLRVIKPIIKKASDFVKKKLGKKIYKPSREEIRANQYRQSKGLSPLNFEKMKKKG